MDVTFYIICFSFSILS